MKSFYSLCIALILSAPLAMAQQHDHQSPDAAAQAQEGQDQMMKLHADFLHMRELMAKVEMEKDPKARHELMQQHLQLMREGMNMMRRMQIEMMKQGTMNHGDDKMDMDERMGMLNHHLSMMGDMLKQMEQHSAMLEE